MLPGRHLSGSAQHPIRRQTNGKIGMGDLVLKNVALAGSTSSLTSLSTMSSAGTHAHVSCNGELGGAEPAKMLVDSARTMQNQSGVSPCGKKGGYLCEENTNTPLLPPGAASALAAEEKEEEEEKGGGKSLSVRCCEHFATRTFDDTGVAYVLPPCVESISGQILDDFLLLLLLWPLLRKLGGVTESCTKEHRMPYTPNSTRAGSAAEVVLTFCINV
jgi:hypothetical protein